MPVRLVGGCNEYEGRVEVFCNGSWGTVCQGGWDDTDAGVVCRSLGLGESGKAVNLAEFGEGLGDIILTNIKCDGSEDNITSCPNAERRVNSCSHNKDAGIRCSGSGSLLFFIILFFRTTQERIPTILLSTLQSSLLAWCNRKPTLYTLFMFNIYPNYPGTQVPQYSKFLLM